MLNQFYRTSRCPRGSIFVRNCMELAEVRNILVPANGVGRRRLRTAVSQKYIHSLNAYDSHVNNDGHLYFMIMRIAYYLCN
jgi:hypothetical protein